MSFAEAFSERFGCRTVAFENAALWRSLRSPLSLFARLINCTVPGFFDDDRAAIRRLGDARSLEEFLRELDDLDYVAHRRGGFLRLRLGLRLSAAKLDRLQAKLFAGQRRASGASLTGGLRRVAAP